MRIVNVTVNATYAIYPQRIVITIEWSKPIQSFEITNLIFETEDVPGITITGYDPVDNGNTPTQVFLGQTLVQRKDVLMLSPTTMQMSFQVSPFMNGTLRISNQSWNKPLVLVATAADGTLGDWSALLAPGIFNSVRCTAYYSAMKPTDTTSIDYNQPLRGLPRIRNPWTCTGVAQSNKWTGASIIIGHTNDFPVEPLLPWEGGNFWYWQAAGCRYGPIPLSYPYGPYYSTNDTRTCSGPPGYTFCGLGGQDVTSTQLPAYTAEFNYTTITNSYGSKLASNTRGGNANLDHGYWPCPYYGTGSSTQGSGRNSAIGRFESWIMANPYNGDPLKDMPATWTNQVASSVNNNCLAPWRLAKPTDPVPMLIQVYYQLNYLYTSAAPVP